MNKLLKSRAIATLTRPTWLDKAGMGKGIDHDRQHLGIILASGHTIKVRQTNPKFTSLLTLRLLNDDSKAEFSIKIGAEWVALSATVASVPFIDTPYQEGSPIIEYEYPLEVKILPVFQKGEQESIFLNAWETQQAEFSLIQTPYAIILIPQKDIQAVRNLKEHGGIDGLVDYYESIFTFYNSLAGISFEPASASDRNIANRYFIKADKNGVGAAYYSSHWAASNSGSIGGYWLNPTIRNWGALHEIGHGYQGAFSSDQTFYTGEIWNNIYVIYWQHAWLGERKYQEDGMYNGKQELFERSITKHIIDGNPVENWGLGQRLYFFVLMIDAAGKKAFTNFNQQYRKNMNTPDFVAGEHPILDMLTHSLARSGNQVDVTPFARLVRAPITEEQSDRNLFSKASAVYPLNQLLQGEELNIQQGALKLGSNFTLVQVEQLLPSGLTGDVTLEIEIDNLNQIYGEALIVMDGERYVRQLIIDTKKLLIQKLPIGVYSLRLPTGRNIKYCSSPKYLIVRPGNNNHILAFLPRTTSALATQKIWILGKGNWSFGWLLVDSKERAIKLSITKDNPHPGYADFYSRVMVRDTKGAELFNLAIPGQNAVVKEYDVSFLPGYELSVEHVQLGGFHTEVPGIIDAARKNQAWTLSELGLKNVTLDIGPIENYMRLLKRKIDALRGEELMMNAPCFEKVEIYLAIQQLPMPERELLLSSCIDCTPTSIESGLGKIVEAVDGVLDLTAISGDASVRIDRWPLMAAGQRLWLRLHGTKVNDMPYTIPRWDNSYVNSAEASRGYLTKHILRSELELLKKGSLLRVEFKVTFDQSHDENLAVTFPISDYIIK